MAFPTPTKNFHKDTYDSISPSRPELSVSGRRIVITGGGYGLGRELVKTFAEAGAAEIAILGRSEGPLVETTKLIAEKYPKTKVSHYVADITDLAAVKKAAEGFGKWNTLILNAGYMPDRGSVGGSDVDEFWKGYEINVKGVVVALNAFLPTKGEDAVVVGTSTAGIIFPKNMTGGFTSYVASKQALVNLIEYAAVEEEDVHFVNIHPGVLDTGMYAKFDNPDLVPDTFALSTHFALWITSKEARFLRGKFVWCNWDVDELKANAKEIQEDKALWTTTVAGFPYQTLGKSQL